MFNQEEYLKALNFAAFHHGEQKTPNDLPYLTHLSAVCMEVMHACVKSSMNENESNIAISCALLHDVLEDTKCSEDDLYNNFSETIVMGIESLTKDTSLKTKKDQMQDSLNKLLAQPYCVQMVKLADRITNLQKPPKHWDKEKIASYLKEAKLIFSCLKNANIYLAKRLEEKIENYKQYL